MPNPNICGYLTTPQVYLTQDGDINDSHPGYTSGVELDISTRITQEHIQDLYMTNLNLHRRSTDLEAALQKAETLLRERAQQIRELEEVPKIHVSLDTREAASTHTLLQQMLNPLIDNQDAAPAPATLFPKVTTDMP